MLLVADIGNTETVLGLWSDEGAIIERWRLRTDLARTPDEVGVMLRALLDTRAAGPPAEGCFVASVVPPYTRVFAEGVTRHLGLAVEELGFAPALGIRLEVDEPAQVGADRLANVLAAHLRYPGSNVVVDLGTATTFDIVAADGEFVGGAIAPGVELMASTLFQRTALLPRVAPGFPGTFLGRTTVENMQIGIYRGAVAMIDGIVAGIRAEWDPGARAIATGGLAPLLAPRCTTIDVVDPDLTLLGIGWAHERLHPRTV